MRNYGIDTSVLNAPWMIEPTAMDHLAATLRHTDMDAALRIYRETAADKDADPEYYELRDGTAILRISGTLTPEEGFFSRLFGGSGSLRTYAAIRAAVAAADKDPSVKRKLMVINSPGGTVAGAFEAAHFLNASASIKPLYAYADGQMTSAAQLLGATAAKIAAPKTAQVGSIGVLWAHVNEEKLNEKIGIDVTYLHAGRYKAFGNPDEALSAEARAYFQDRLDRTYAFFIDDVAGYRNMTPEAVSAAADGRVFLADQGREAGLVDVIVNDFEDFFTTLTQEDQPMDVNELKTQHPDLYAQVLDQGKKEGRDAAAAQAPDPEAAKKQAVDSVLSVMSAVAGQELADKVKKITDLGLTAEQLEAARALLAPSGGNGGPEDSGQSPADPPAGSPTRQQMLDAINGAASAPLTGGGGQPGAGPKDFEAAVTAIVQEQKCSRTDAIKSAQEQYPDLHKAYIDTWNQKQS